MSGADREAAVAWAWALIEADDHTGAAALLEGETGDEARYALGRAYRAAGRFDEARTVYRQLWQEAQAENHPGTRGALHQCGMVEREAGEFAAALELFQQERELIETKHLGALARAVNGYELAVCRHALGQEREAHAALAEAFAEAVAADAPVTLGCLWRAAGDFARAEGRTEAAQDAYTNAKTHFAEAKDEGAVAEMEERLRSPADAAEG